MKRPCTAQGCGVVADVLVMVTLSSGVDLRYYTCATHSRVVVDIAWQWNPRNISITHLLDGHVGLADVAARWKDFFVGLPHVGNVIA